MFVDAPICLLKNADISTLLRDMGACSKQEAKRLIEQGAVEVAGEKVGRFADIYNGDVLKCGKRFWRRIRCKPLFRMEVTVLETADTAIIGDFILGG